MPPGGASWAPFELADLAVNLPSDSACGRALGWADLTGEVDSSWSLDSMLLADIVDAVRGANWQRGGGANTRPLPVNRPGYRRSEKSNFIEADGFESINDFRAWYDKAIIE